MDRSPNDAQRSADGRKLELFLRQAQAFRLGLALYNDPAARDHAIRELTGELADENVHVLTLDLREPPSDERTFLTRVDELVKNAAVPSPERVAVMVVNLESRVDYAPEFPVAGSPGASFLQTVNLHRELFPGVCPGPLIVWMTELLERALMVQAPDFWHWRSHVFDLRTRTIALEAVRVADHQGWSNDDFRRHPEDRLRRLEEELAAYRKAGMPDDEARTLNAIGLARFHAGEAGLAIRDFEGALSIALHTGNQQYEGMALGNLGNAYAALGKWRRAIESYEQVLQMARHTGDQQSEARALGNLGVAHEGINDPRKAIDFHEQALSIDRQIGDRQGEGADLGNLGVTHADLGEFREAIGYFEQALAISREVGDPRVEGNALGALGSAYAALGESRKAVDFFAQQLEIARRAGDRRGEGIGLRHLADELWKSGERKEAIAQMAAALAVYEAIKHPGASRARAVLKVWREED